MSAHDDATSIDAEQPQRDIVERLLQPMSSDPSEVQRERYLAAQEITRLRAQPSPREVALEKALAPFAALLDTDSNGYENSNGDVVVRSVGTLGRDHAFITVGDLRRAKAALASDGRKEITRLRAQPSPREVALEKALRELAIDSYYAGSELRHYCRICLEEWRIGTGEKHTPECLLAASPEPAMLSARKEDGHEPE